MGEPVHAAQFPPVLKLSDALDEDYRQRLEVVRSKYHAAFGSDPEFYVRAPGRVNLIGEHVDYCGYAVLPMAVQQDILIGCGRNNTSTLQLANVDGRYQSYSAPMESLKIDDVQPCWHHYFMCGVKAALENGVSCKLGVSSPGLDVMVHGTVPPSAGLSSSSAVVCAAALATLQANKAAETKLKLASLCAASERYIGTQGGGMDQAIAFLAEAGTAKLIEFNPLRTTSVALPDGAMFVVANSLVEMNKAATSDFNIRVAECHIAAQVIAKARGLEHKKQLKLGELQSLLQVSLPEMVTLVKKILHPAVYTRDELCTLLDMDNVLFEKSFLSKNTKHLQEFKLHQRAVHVYEEASRVWQFKDICEGSGGHLSAAEQLSQLGQLMNESHTSCRDLYECSHPDLDRLVEISLEAGALGSRLTGAGWGGCSISLVPSDKLATFLKEVGNKFYGQLGDSIAKDTAMFVTKPGSGAAVFIP
uniref:Galactokinase n=1 Tax=Amblyomma maculatum TaxID=34609 RepID=G3MRA9_AMBMU